MNWKAYSILLLFLILLTSQDSCEEVVAEKSNVSLVREDCSIESSITTDYVVAYLSNPPVEESGVFYFPSFDISNSQIADIVSLQGVKAKFPEIVPKGFERDRGVSLRKTLNGHIAKDQLIMNRFFFETEPLIVEDNGLIEYQYRVPISLLTDITYAGVVYTNREDNQDVNFLIRLTTPASLNDKVLQGIHIETGAVKNDISKILVNDKITVFLIVREVGSVTGLFLIAIPQDSIDDIINKRSDHTIITYEISSNNTDVQTLIDFANELR